MASSITNTIYVWLKQNRLMGAVAQRMGIPESTLTSQLRSSYHQAKLGADQLVPLFRAIRELKYGRQLDGIVARFVHELEGEAISPAGIEQFRSLVFAMMDGLGALSKAADHIEDVKTERELMRLKTKIRTEIIPAVYKLEDIVDLRLEQLRQEAENGAPNIDVAPEES